MPPPPPPPPVPPLPAFGKGSAKPPKMNRTEQVDRNALLSQIRLGANLKKTSTNDRSAPLIEGRKSSLGGSSGSTQNVTNGPSPLIPPGGLFAQGMPKLRPTGCRPGAGDRIAPAPPLSHSEGIFLSSDENHINAIQSGPSTSRSHPPSPAFKLRQTSPSRIDHSGDSGNKGRYGPGGVKRSPFPSDVNVKGPAPVPPPACQKPNIGLDSAKSLTNVSEQSQGGPSLPSRPPGVRRSVSQTSLGPRSRPGRPPPNVRPPPPPKTPVATQNGPPAPPSKPPNLMRRQSFGVGDITNGPRASSHHHHVHSDVTRLSVKAYGPPPPPRNNSAPYNLHQLNNAGSPVSYTKMTAAPPPPPSRMGGSVPTKPPSVRPPPPPVRTPAPPPPPPPPPPLPHHRLGHPVPPSQAKAAIPHQPPPPPTRVSSVRNVAHSVPVTGEFESRFFHKFHGIHELPVPEKYTNMIKHYPSKMQSQVSRRQPPPPPPAMGNGSVSKGRGGHSAAQPVLHIQLEPRMFTNNITHC